MVEGSKKVEINNISTDVYCIVCTWFVQSLSYVYTNIHVDKFMDKFC